MSSDEASDLMNHLKSELNWSQKVGWHGKEPLLTCWFVRPYAYSNVKLDEAPTRNERLADLMERCAEVAGHPFNSVFCNLYRDSKDSIGWHADGEHELASVSLGATRIFELATKSGRQPVAQILLDSGSLLIMGRSTQEVLVLCVLSCEM